MKKRDDVVYLTDILDAIGQIEAYVQGVERTAFEEDCMRQDAVVRQIEIIGEASRNISPAFQILHPEIPWSKVIGMPHKIVHDYFEVDLSTIWDTVKNDLPPLKRSVSAILGKR
jgi:uncharacterized protein with HEPN domain